MKYYSSNGTCILISFIIASFSFSCQCQPNKPTAKWNMLVGGSASFDWSSAESTYQGQSLENYKENRSVCDFRFGFFPINNLLTGISFNASLFNSKVESSPKVTSYDYLVTPFIRYYLKIGVFAETSFQFGYMAPLSSTRPEDNLLSTESYNIGIGYSLFLTDYLAIESTISYYLKKLSTSMLMFCSIILASGQTLSLEKPSNAIEYEAKYSSNYWAEVLHVWKISNIDEDDEITLHFSEYYGTDIFSSVIYSSDNDYWHKENDPNVQTQTWTWQGPNNSTDYTSVPFKFS